MFSVLVRYVIHSGLIKVNNRKALEGLGLKAHGFASPLFNII